MSNKYKNIIFIVFIILVNTTELSYPKNSTQHGGIVKLFYAPFGYGNVIVPFEGLNSGIIQSKITSPGKGDYPMSNLTCYKVTAGYFYGYFQAEFSYFGSFFKDQDLLKTDDTVYQTIKGEYSFFDIKSGLRFNNPGDSSYNWLYLGFKRMAFETSYNNTEGIAYGVFIGFMGFHSFGVESDFEFVIDYDFSFGVFQQLTIATNINLKSKDELTLNPGISLGLGVQYEPYNLSLLLKMSPEFVYSSKMDGEKDVGVGIIGMFLGFEITAVIPSYKFNKR